MDFTLANSFTTDAGTGQRMHLRAQAVPTEVTDVDMNALIWSAMELVKDAGLSGAQFDKATPASYQVMREAIRIMIRRQTGCVGVATRGGTDVYTSDLAVDLAALVNGVRLSLRATAANTTTTPTLAVDATAAKTIVRSNNQPLQVGDIAGAGHWLQLVYDAGNDRWVLLNPALGIDLTPAGVVIAHAANAAPAGYLKANGAAVSRTVYAALFTAIGTTFGVGDGSTTFNVPNLRAEFIRGWDDGRGVDTGRVFGSTQAQSLQTHNHALTGYNTNSTGGINGDIGGAYPNTKDGGATYPGFTASTGSTETRPANVALLYCIKF